MVELTHMGETAVLLKAWKVAPKSIKILYISTLSMYLGFYALIPYLVLHLTGQYYWSLALVGMLLAARQFSQQGLTFIGGIIADRYGCKQTLIVGILVRGAGFASFAFCSENWHFFVAAIISGLGGALFEPALQAAYIRLSPLEHRNIILTLRNIIINVSMAGSAIVGSILVLFDFYYLSLFSGSIYLFIGFYIIRYLPRIEVEVSRVKVVQDLLKIVRDKPFIMFNIALIGYYYLALQLFLTIPQLAETVMGSKSGVAYVYATIALTIIIFQVYITNKLQHFTNRFALIGFGILIMGIGLFSFSFADTLWILFTGAILYAIGSMIAGPLVMDVIPSFAPPQLIASYYGFNGYSIAIGGALSTVVGGWFYDIGMKWGWPGLPWTICFVIAILSAGSLIMMKEKNV